MRLAFALALVAALARAEEPQPDPGAAPTPHGRLAGRVLERGSTSPLVGASVIAGPQSAITDEHGGFVLDLAPGEIDVVVSATNYEAMVFRERIAPREQLNVEYRLLADARWRQRYRTVVRGEARHEGERFTLQDEELRQVPGGLGDPFRVVGALPGVATPLPILPYFVVRGATPGMNGFFLDGMRLPQLFHSLVGGGVIHPRLVDKLDFYAGAYDVSFGRYAGGVIDAATRPGRSDAPLHGEAELHLYDVSTLVEGALPHGITWIASGHYGFPSPVINIIEPRVKLQYWDYQLRGDWHGLTVEAIGSSDFVELQRSLSRPGAPPGPPDNYSLQFHRVQLREQVRSGRLEAEAAVVGGVDNLSIFGGQGVRKLALGARALVRLGLPRLRLQAGVDGELSRFTAMNFSSDNSVASPDSLGELGGSRDGAEAGAYAEGTLVLDDILRRPLSLNAGVRVDTYHAGTVTLLGVDPRFFVKYGPTDWLSFDAGFGLYQQPPSFPVALPGVDTFALQLGLQRAWQGAVGITAKLPSSFSLTTTGFFERFFNINDVVADFSAISCTAPPPESLTGVSARVTRQVDGQSFGMELLLRRTAGRVTGWVAYTLSRSEREYSCGLRPSDFDQTHILNVVVQVRLPWQIMAGGRLFFSTGRPFTHLQIDPAQLFSGNITVPPRNNDRLPNFLEVDLRVDREWVFSRFAVAGFVEVLNLTYSQSVFGITYPVDPATMITRYDQPTLSGFRWILPSVGVRGRF